MNPLNYNGNFLPNLALHCLTLSGPIDIGPESQTPITDTSPSSPPKSTFIDSVHLSHALYSPIKTNQNVKVVDYVVGLYDFYISFYLSTSWYISHFPQ